jgi:hypothetical protein
MNPGVGGAVGVAGRRPRRSGPLTPAHGGLELCLEHLTHGGKGRTLAVSATTRPLRPRHARLLLRAKSPSAWHPSARAMELSWRGACTGKTLAQSSRVDGGIVVGWRPYTGAKAERHETNWPVGPAPARAGSPRARMRRARSVSWSDDRRRHALRGDAARRALSRALPAVLSERWGRRGGQTGMR